MNLFISYAREDRESVAQIAAILRESGREAWYDLDLLPHGSAWKDELEKSIQRCDLFVFVITPASVASDWCQWELSQAITAGKPIIPILLKEADIPEPIRRMHYVTFSGRNYQDLLAHVAYAIEAHQLKPSELEETKPEEFASEPEEVFFTHFYPATVMKDSLIPLHVYVHLMSARQLVEIDFESRRSFRSPVSSLTEKGSLLWRRGTVFTIVPFFGSARVVPPFMDVPWEDEFEHVQFTVKCRGMSEASLKGEVRIYVGPLIVGVLSVSVLLTDEDMPVKQSPQFRTETRTQYRKLFISYSRDDEALVKTVDKFYERHPEIETFVDYKFLQSGDYWWDTIKHKIEEAEAMQLFWSPSSCKSKNVENEWRHALSLPRPILPVIFGRPRPTIPSDLDHVHFEEFDRFLAVFAP